jgi:hypothetical protein
MRWNQTMRQVIALLAVVMTAACSQGAGNPVAHASASSSQQPSPSQTASPSQPAPPTLLSSPDPTLSAVPLPSAFPDLPLTKVTFSCRLPAYSQQGLETIVDSFISFPANTATVDPNGKNGMYYDRAYSRWLPVPRSGVSPDGAGYAYVDFTQTEYVVHVVAVVSGKDVTIHFTNGNGPSAPPIVLDYSAEGIYLAQAFEHLLAGLWLLDPSTGSVRQVSKDIYPVRSAGAGVIWVQLVNPADPNPVFTGSSAGTLPDEIDRVDLKSGTQATWLYKPGSGLGVAGLDAQGHPLMVSELWGGADSNAELSIVSAPGTSRLIYKGWLVQTLTGSVTDSHGVWFGSAQGIYLYSDAEGLRKVSNTPGLPANGCF